MTAMRGPSTPPASAAPAPSGDAALACRAVGSGRMTYSRALWAVAVIGPQVSMVISSSLMPV
jgi:hypothetical protein